MKVLDTNTYHKRYESVEDKKNSGATYTPKILADFVAQEITKKLASKNSREKTFRILDPAVGHGELLVSLLEMLDKKNIKNIEVYGFETNGEAFEVAEKRLAKLFPSVVFKLKMESFLDYVIKNFDANSCEEIFRKNEHKYYDVVIANPPYVRTQIMGALESSKLSKEFGLNGRVDLYFAFIIAISRVLKPDGVAGVIVSNRFMTTSSGKPVRKALVESFSLCHVWDFGDTKIFEAAILPAVFVVKGKNGEKCERPLFTSIYETKLQTEIFASNPVDALSYEGVVEVNDGRRFNVLHGTLNTGETSDGVWRIATDEVDSWLKTVFKSTWGTFRDIGKIRVGVKTCADKVFIRNDWHKLPRAERPELLKPLTTHYIAQRFKPLVSEFPKQILYSHEVVDGKRRVIDLEDKPLSKVYLEKYRSRLEGREYVIKANRKWYEIWVPQDPDAWEKPKLVFRDISEKPTFWLDLEGSVVNGDCYWLVCESNQEDLLWLAAAVGNSTFIEKFYDASFNNKLYSGRRRFITQYVEKFPLPDPGSLIAKEIIKKTKEIYKCMPSEKAEQLYKELDGMVWESFTGSHTD